jgi:ferric-dicitrate binding protein FerR (iron transport regulator)
MNNRQEDINKLLLDPTFRNWALKQHAEDAEKWDRIIASDGDLHRLALEAKELIILAELEDHAAGAEASLSFDKMLQKTREKVKSNSVNASKGNVRKWGVGTFLKIAAAISFFAVFGTIAFLNHHSGDGFQSNVSTVEKSTQGAQQMTLTLPDGSRVRLNSNSTLIYGNDFMSNRVVRLKGEAFFDVVRDARRPFIVQTKTFQTEVLGTAFNINAYNSQHARVSVAEGKVRVTSASDKSSSLSTVLQREEAVQILDDQLLSVKYDQNDLLWKEGILVFQSESIYEISDKIERWYNVKVTIENSDAIAAAFTGKYANERLNDVLDGMSYAMGFDYLVEDDQVILIGGTQKK